MGKIDIWFRDNFNQPGRLIHKDVYYFLFQTSSQAILVPDPNQHSYQAKWVSVKSLLKTSNYVDMVPIIEKALTFIKQ